MAWFRSLLVLLFLLPAAAAPAQIRVQIDTTYPDPDCDDFDTQMQAQGWYYFFREGTDKRDAARLDGDGDGQACEGIEVAKMEVFALDTAKVEYVRDSTRRNISIADEGDVWIQYELIPARVSCGELPDEVFDVRTFLEETERSVDSWNREYLSYVDMAECLHMIGVLKDY